MEQRSKEWFKTRAGIPTASNFHRIITPSGAPSGQAQGYMCRLLAERIFKRSLDDSGTTKWMRHGIDYEDEAAIALIKETGESMVRAGFILSENGLWGCSPDLMLTGKNAIAEIKCPAPWTHVEYLLHGLDKDYRPQVQGQMLVGGWDYVYFFSYFPGMPHFLKITCRDHSYIKDMQTALTTFSRNLERYQSQIEEWPINLNIALDVLSKLMPEREE